MVVHKLVPTLTLLVVLGAPAKGGAETSRRPRPDEPGGGPAAALLELRERVASWWSEIAGGEPADAAGQPAGPGPTGSEGQGGYDPSGSTPPPTGDFGSPG
jgi:hypothetical protein